MKYLSLQGMQRIEHQRVLVTGGAGFIGSHLCEDLLKHHNQVVCLDNFSNGKRSNIEAFLNRPDFNLIEGDIRDLSTCLRASKGCDVILHQAALGSVPIHTHLHWSQGLSVPSFAICMRLNLSHSQCI